LRKNDVGSVANVTDGALKLDYASAIFVNRGVQIDETDAVTHLMSNSSDFLSERHTTMKLHYIRWVTGRYPSRLSVTAIKLQFY